ncbi:MAG: lysophospholipid acyltransferase family protein [Candidatus Pacearchaeota archaeon]|nr:lysophospholipid acyltransferase family protein [Candidatus Pacearchaeota archaeon]
MSGSEKLRHIGFDSLCSYAESKKGTRYIHSLAPNLSVEGADNAKRIIGENPVLYAVNHQSMLDYFLPLWGVLGSGLPFARAIAGSNLNNWFVRTFLFDMAPWGVIWHSKDDGRDMRGYMKAVIDAFGRGDSVLVFPEGTRNRHPEKGLAEFKTPFFRLVVSAQDRIDKERDSREIYVCPVACNYDKIPEDGFFERIDQPRTPIGRMKYYFWDFWAGFRWRHFVSEESKGNTIVRFGTPVALRDIAGEGNKYEKAERICEAVRGRLETLLSVIKEETARR